MREVSLWLATGCYTGDVNAGGLPDGNGYMEYSNGETYDGAWKDGKLTRGSIRDEKFIEQSE